MNNKMKLITICLLIICSIRSGLNAQIIYTDIPDVTPSASYPLDLNNDQIDDFLLQFDAGFKIMCKPQNNNAYSGELSGGNHLPWAISQTMNICDTMSTWFDANNPGIMAWDTSIGHWIGATDKYLALKLVVGTNSYYGWARLDVLPTSSSFTLKDYAYEGTPNACIVAGQLPLSIKSYAAHQEFAIYPNPFNSSTTILSNGYFKNVTVQLINSFGQIVQQVRHINQPKIILSRQHLPEGLYILRITENGEILAEEKLVITEGTK